MIKTNVRRRSAPGAAPRVPPGRRSGPANDNARRPRPSNDNRPRVSVPNNARRLGLHGRWLLNNNPYIRIAGEALNILDLLAPPVGEGWSNLGTWSVNGQCASPNPVYNLGRCLVSQSSAYPGTTTGNLANACTPGQSFSSNVWTIGDPWAGVGDWARSVAIGNARQLSGGSYRAQVVWSFHRPASGSFSPPVYKTAQAAVMLAKPEPNTWVYTANQALASPGHAPAFAAPVPWALNKYWQAPNRETAHHVASGAARDPAKVPNLWSVSIQAGARNAPHQAPRFHAQRPPPKSGPEFVKETKQKFTPRQAAMMSALSKTTELFDFIDIMYNNLPPEYRPRYRNTKYEKKFTTPAEKFLAIVRHGDKINYPQAMQDMIDNNLEDAVIGRFGQAGGDLSKQMGWGYGQGVHQTMSRISRKTYDEQRATDRQVRGEN